MITPHAQPASDAKARLAKKKSIDAICDGFEEAWARGSQPRIEDYLSAAAEADRAELFRELMASELALRGPDDPNRIRDAYLQRFPAYREIVLATFASMSTQHLLGDSREGNEAHERLIETVRQRLRLKENRAAGVDGEDPPSIRPASSEPPSERLWEHLFRHASNSDRSRGPSAGAFEDVELLEQVTQKLIDAFPTLRRNILVSLLLGDTLDQTAERHRCSERTVDVTRQAAIELLGRSRME
jgi:hypothetical protein